MRIKDVSLRKKKEYTTGETAYRGGFKRQSGEGEQQPLTKENLIALELKKLNEVN